MDTIGIDQIITAQDESDIIEVLVGIAENTSVETIDSYCGDDGTVLNETGLGIARLRLTVSCLQDLKNGGDPWIDYIEPAVQYAKPSLDIEHKTDYTKL